MTPANQESGHEATAGRSTGFALAVLAGLALAPVARAAHGELDRNFGGGDGVVTTGITAGTDERARAAAVQPFDGKLVVAASVAGERR
ncbi:MAG TPA: hypothetical protein VF529_13155 [Solirubrobacteraceae bacterium]